MSGAFKIVFSDVEIFRDVINIISSIIDDGILKVNKNGISMTMPDRSMISVVDFIIPANVLDNIDVIGDSAEIGIKVSDLNSILKKMKRGKLTINSDASTVELVLERDRGGKRRFVLPIIEVSSEVPPVSDLKFNAKVEIDAELLEEAIDDCSLVDESLVIESNVDKFKIWAKSETAEASIEIKKGEEGLIDIKCEKEERARYAISYLEKIIKAKKFSNNAIIEFSTDYPMKITFEEKDRIRISFILAPRVEE